MRRIASVVMLIASASAAAAQPASLEHIRGGLYQLREGQQVTLVYVVDGGAVIADLRSRDAARWLRNELASRFSQSRPRYLIYTTRPSGPQVGDGFPGAAMVAHVSFNDDLPPTRRTTFSDRGTLSIGNSSLDIANPGGAGSTPAVYFRSERVLYTGANPAFDQGGFSFGDAKPVDVIRWLRGVATLPFDLVVTGRGERLNRDAFDALLRYAEDLYTTGVRGFTGGWSTAQTAAVPELQRHTGSPLDAQRRGNLDSLFRSARVTRIELQGAAMVGRAQPNQEFCAGYTRCLTGGDLTGASAALRFVESRFGVLLEAAVDDQTVSRRESEIDDEIFVQRTIRGSLLLRYGKIRPSSPSIELLMGPTVVVGKAEGAMRIKGALSPLGGRHSFSETSTVGAGTLGVNLIWPFSRAMSMYVPVRLTWTPVMPARWSGPVDAHAGIGFSLRMAQRVH